MALTAVSIKNAKGRAKPYKLTDGDGLFLYVTPNGGRYWRMNYRYLGKQKTLAFGVYPDTGLAEAREQRDGARKVLARGYDPAEQIKLEKVAAAVAASNSFKAVADEWLVKVEREGRSGVTMKKLRWLLDFINASIGKRPVASISAQELLVMLRKMESKGRYETAKRLRSTPLRHRHGSRRARRCRRSSRRIDCAPARPPGGDHQRQRGGRSAAGYRGVRGLCEHQGGLAIASAILR